MNSMTVCVCVCVCVLVYECMCGAVKCSLKQQSVLGKCVLRQNNGIWGKNIPRSVGGKEKEPESEREREEREQVER